MNTLWRWFIIILAVALVAASTLLMIRNFHPASLDIIFIKVELPLIIILLVSFVFGVFFSWLLHSWLLFTQKRKIKQLNKQLADCKQEVSQLRQSPMNGMH